MLILLLSLCSFCLRYVSHYLTRNILYSASIWHYWDNRGIPGQFSTALSPLDNSLPVTFPQCIHGNNVAWLWVKYAVDANLFQLESPILMRSTNWNVRGKSHGGELPVGESNRGEMSVRELSRGESAWGWSVLEPGLTHSQ